MAKIVLNHPRKLPATYYKSIGELVAKWNLLDLHVQSLIWHFLGLGFKEGRVLTYRLGVRDKTNTLRAVILKWVDDIQIATELKAIAKRVDDLNDDRNTIIHGVWGHEKAKPRQLRLLLVKQAGDRILPRAPLKTANDIQNITQQIDNLDRRLIQIHRSVGARVP